MIKITFLGTGSAMATDKYNTCFLIQEEKGHTLLVDSGGGHEILRQFKENNINIRQLDAIFISHSHADHVLGFPFLFREMVLSKKEIKILCSGPVMEDIIKLIKIDLQEKADNNMNLLQFQNIEKNPKYYNYFFFPVDERQKGFILDSEKKIAFTGDSPATNRTLKIIRGNDIIIHEAFCSTEEKDQIIGVHSTIEEVISIFNSTLAKKLIIVHQKNIPERFNSNDIKIVRDGEIIII